MNYYPHNIGDYSAATAHLTTLEDCFYRRMLDRYYQTEQPLPANLDVLCRLLRARGKDEREAVAAVAGEFFVLDGDGYRQKRCDEEIVAYRARAETAKENGKRGGRPRKTRLEPDGNPIETNPVISGLANQNPDVTQTKANQETEPRNKTNNPPKPPRRVAIGLPEGFGVSARVKAWASEKGYSFLEKRLEHFIGYARRSGKTYVDWDEAFMSAIREDWAKLGAATAPTEAPTVQPGGWQ